MSEEFRARDWVSLGGIRMDLGPLLPKGVFIPKYETLVEWCENATLPAWRRPGGWLVARRDLPRVAQIITRIRQIQQLGEQHDQQ